MPEFDGAVWRPVATGPRQHATMQRRKTPHVESSRNVELTDLVTTRKQINGVKGRMLLKKSLLRRGKSFDSLDK